MMIRSATIAAIGLGISCGMLRAQAAAMEASDRDLYPPERFVLVDLDAYANDKRGIDLPGQTVTVNGIPFQTVRAAGADNVFLEKAGWSDWREDPSSFIADYDKGPSQREPGRILLRIPVADYSAVHLLAVAEDSPAYSDVVSLRIGAMGGMEQVKYHDFSQAIPRAEADGGAGAIATENGNIFLVRIPLERAMAQDFPDQLMLSVDVTKALRLAIRRPDPCRFHMRPLGLPSGVHIFGMTFETAPAQLEVHGIEPGNVFNQPATPTFEITLKNRAGRRLKEVDIEASATDYHGNVTKAALTNVAVAAVSPTTVRLALDVAHRGYHALTVRVKGARVLLTRQTSFALLAPDTRQYRAESPFGVWDFGGQHYTSDDPDLLGPLYVKAGLRYGMFSDQVFGAAVRRKYGILKGNDPKPQGAEKVERYARMVKENPDLPEPERLMIFHEDAISGEHLTRTPSFFTGRPYEFNEKEQAKFDRLWKTAEETARAMQKHFPQAEIYFFNGTCHLMEEFVKHGFPRELLGSHGNESGNFMRMPETQPLDFVANNAGLWMDRTILDAYGYADVPLRQCYEICCPSTNPGNLTPATQGRYLVRHMMHSLAWGIPIIRPMLITDVGNSYYFSNWGAAGLCYGMPDISPKPAYVAMAVLTQTLDGATLSRVVPTGSPVVYALEFRRKDGTFVTVLWTLRGVREAGIAMAAAGDGARIDLMGNERTLAMDGDRVTVTLTADPVYLVGGPARSIVLGDPVYDTPATADAFLISTLGNLDEWDVEGERNAELECYNFESPRRQGRLEFSAVSSFEGAGNALRIDPGTPDDPELPYLRMYTGLRHATGIAIPGTPTEIGLMVNGNGGWGHVIFELEDASGQRWISIGAEQAGKPTRWLADALEPEEFERLNMSGINDWNTHDVWQRAYVNFEGWRYVRFPLPGNYPGERYHWPYSSQWKYDKDGIVHYPLKFTRLAIDLPEGVLHFTEYKAVERPEIYVKDLRVTYQPPEEAFVAE